MGNFLSKGTTFVDGVTVVDDANLNAHVDDATIKPEAISALSLKDPLAGTETFMVNDAGTLKKATIQAVQESAVAAGTVVDYAGTTAPAGWFFCYGQLLSRVTYSLLFAAIGTTYGAGDGTTFAVPDLRGRVVAGRDNMGGADAQRFHPTWAGSPYFTGVNGLVLGSAGGHALHQLTVAELASHAHSFSDYYQTTVLPGGGGNIQFGNDNHPVEQGAFINNGTAGAGSSQHHSITQPTMILNKIIKY